MTLAQFQRYTPGQIIDRSRHNVVSRNYDAPLKRYTVTVGGTAASGGYSFVVDGTTVSFTASVGADTNTTIAEGLKLAALSNDIDVLEIAAISRTDLVITLIGYETGDSFTVENAVAPGGATLTIANPENGVRGDLELGIAVAMLASDPNGIRRPLTGDTRFVGVVAEGGGIKDSTGDTDDVDGYKPGGPVQIVRRGQVPVVVEEAVSAGDLAYVRVEVDTDKVQGEFRSDAGGVSQITTGDVEFSTTDPVGLVVDSLTALFVASNTSDDQTATDLRNAWNGSAQHYTVATASIDISGAESLIILTFNDFEDHTVIAHSPATADVTSITNTTEAVSERAVLVPGEFVSDSYADATTGKLVAILELNAPS